MRAGLSLPVMLALVVPLGASGSEPGAVPFTLRDSTDIIVPATVSGQGPIRFRLDTGSNRSAVSERLARTLRLSAIGDTTVVTPAGKTTRRLVRVVIGVGDVTVSATAMVWPAKDLGQGVDGLMGTDLLAARRFTIDYARRRLCFDRCPTSPAGASMSLIAAADGFVATLPDNDGQAMRWIPDTGAASFVLFLRVGRTLPKLTPLGAVPVRAAGSLGMGRAVVIEHLQFGEIQVRDQLAVVMNGSNVDERLGDGLLPLHLFAQARFDGPGGSLALVPYK